MATPEHKYLLGVAMSVPRLGFMDNMFCIHELRAAVDFPMPVRRFTGAYWGQCLTRVLKTLLDEDDCAFIMTNDYDTIFKAEAVQTMLDLMIKNPGIDAVAPVQMHRIEPRPLFTVQSENGGQNIPDDYFDDDVSRINTAHMGCMILRADSLRKIAKPWFWSQPDPNGEWEHGHVDEDIWFWQQWEKAGNTLYLANRVNVGHAELLIRWASNDDRLKGREAFDFIDQHPAEFWKQGYPGGIWK